MAKLYFPGNVPNMSSHHWSAGVALAHSVGHKGALAGAKAVSGAVLDCLQDPGLVAEAKRTFKEEIGGEAFQSLLPPHQRPPLDLNRELMARFRPLMAAHYLHEDARFE
jgi:aminobenzoyl-glutamate utilization protein B